MQNKRKTRNDILILFMIFMDIFIKIIIDNFFIGKKLLVNDNIGFLPFLNEEQLSIFNNELGADIELNYLIVINLIGIIAVICVRNRLKKEKEWSTGYDMGTIMVLVGTICSLIDKIFWKGSLDYILLFSNIVDLKDIYMFVGLLMCIMELCRQEVIKGHIRKHSKE